MPSGHAHAVAGTTLPTARRLATVVRGNRAADCGEFTLWLCYVRRPGLVGSRVYGPDDPVWIREARLGRYLDPDAVFGVHDPTYDAVGWKYRGI